MRTGRCKPTHCIHEKPKKRLTKHQSGNKAQHSTETLGVMMTDKFLEAVNKKMLSLTVLLDLSKALETIHHAKLSAKLSSLGCPVKH